MPRQRDLYKFISYTYNKHMILLTFEILYNVTIKLNLRIRNSQKYAIK